MGNKTLEQEKAVDNLDINIFRGYATVMVDAG